ncbi:hypothetical protein [Nonomuraea sp. NPDC050643]|uniref:hypothetical protein n=1 Tax=Nonomuraea sp. NPDC050643 TaxID=3155660 RepID=UPI0033E54188
MPAWKRTADFLFSQVSFSVEAQLRWREEHPAAAPVYAGVHLIPVSRYRDVESRLSAALR